MAVTMRSTAESTPDEGLLVTADRFPKRLVLRQGDLLDDRGQTFAEYGLILALVVLVAAAGLSAFGTGLGAKMTDTFNAVIAAL